MKKIGSFLDKKTLAKRTALDEKSVFYVFQLIIKEEYGRQGAENIKPAFFRDNKIFVKVAGSTWASELWLNRKQIVRRVNEQFGGEEIVDLAMSS